MTLFQNSMVQRWKTIHESWRFAIITFLTIRVFYALWSWTILSIQPLAVQNIDLLGEPVLTIFNLQDSQAYTYLRKINGQDLTFQAAGLDTITDSQTGSVWDIATGTAFAGQYKGTILSPSRTSPSEIFPYHSAKPYPVKWLAVWQRFDANWYTSLAETGYGGTPGDDHFPPLFPLLIRI
ncbi:MAG: hypothetical protein ACXW4M_12935, partial [Anaerolineales bacterium]